MFGLSTRLVGVTVLIAALCGGEYLLQRWMVAPRIVVPEQSLKSLPAQLGEWSMEASQLDPNVFVRIGAVEVADRVCRNVSGYPASLHMAMFDDPMLGVLHSPMNCYRNAGWSLQEESKTELTLSDGRHVPVSVTRWKLREQEVIIVYWYQLAEYTVFSRIDMVATKFDLRNRAIWPPIFKVLIQVPVLDARPQFAREKALELATNIRNWVDTEFPFAEQPHQAASKPAQPQPAKS